MDHPLLPATGYLHVRRWLVGISRADHIFMDKKQEREWCAQVFSIKGDGLAMVLFQMWRRAMPAVAHKDVPLGLVSINKMPEDG